MEWTECPMCMVRIPRIPRTALFRHVTLRHKSANNFHIECHQDGCGSTYKKWPSYYKHWKRHHDTDNEEQIDIANLNHEPIAEVLQGNQEADFQEGANGAQPLEGENLLKWHTSKSIVGLKETSNLPQSTVTKVVNVIKDTTQETLTIVKAMILSEVDPNTRALSVKAVENVFSRLSEFSTVQDVDSAAKIQSFLKADGMVEPQKFLLGTRRVWGKSGRLVQVADYAYIVPFLENLELFLNNRNVLSCIDNPREFDGNFRTLTDGAYFRTHRVFTSDPKALYVVLYYDDIEVTNPLSAKTIKLAMFNFTLGNIYPEYRSQLKVINLVAICTSENLKRYGSEKVLENFIDDMQKLTSEAGVQLNISGRERKFTGAIGFVAGDTPASGFLSGFKEGVGGAFKPCRTCRVDSDAMKEEFLKCYLPMRNAASHQSDLDDLNAPGLTARQKTFLSKLFGVNSKSAIGNIPDTDVTQIFPHDIMHVVHEGSLGVEVTEFLKYCLAENFFTLDNFNASLKSFGYGHLSKDKPPPIEPAHLENGLRQGAANMRALGFSIPFIGARWVPEDDVHLENFIRLLQIVNLLCAFELTEESVNLLRQMICIYLTNFKNLYPERSITPKMHYMTHLPGQVRKFGPLRQQSCFRFEGAHAYFKDLIRKLRNFTNVPYTLSTRRQSKMASDLLPQVPEIATTGFLFNTTEVSGGKRVLVNALEFGEEFVALIPNAENTFVFLANSMKFNGTSFQRGLIILLTCNEDELPTFGEVTDIVVHREEKVLVYDKLHSCEFVFRFNAYEVKPCNPRERQVLNVKNLLFCHPLSLFKCLSKTYVILFDSNRTEFDG